MVLPISGMRREGPPRIPHPPASRSTRLSTPHTPGEHSSSTGDPRSKDAKKKDPVALLQAMRKWSYYRASNMYTFTNAKPEALTHATLTPSGSHGHFKEGDFLFFGMQLMACQNLTILELNVGRSLFNEAGYKHLAVGLPYLTFLQSFSLIGARTVSMLDAQPQKSLVCTFRGESCRGVVEGLSHCKIIEKVVLKDLFMNDDCLEKCADALGALPLLKKIDLSGNLMGGRSFRALIFSLSKTNLEELDLSSNKIESAHCIDIAHLSHMTRLHTLNLSRNRIGNIGCDHLSPSLSLFSLLSLNLSSNRIGSKGLLSLLKGLVAHPNKPLRYLLLAKNFIQLIPDHIAELKNLMTLDVSHNNIVVLPFSITDLSMLHTIVLDGNKRMISPPKILFQTHGDSTAKSRAIREYLAELKRVGCCELRRIKIVLLGEAMAGKTSLMRSFVKGKPAVTHPLERTLVLDISNIVLKCPLGNNPDILVDCFDMGGQEDYRVAQQLFLGGDRTLFLIAVPVNEDIRPATVEKWIRVVGGRSPDGVIAFIATKLDLCASHPERRARVKVLHDVILHSVEKLKLECEKRNKRLIERGILSAEDPMPTMTLKVPSKIENIIQVNYTYSKLNDVGSKMFGFVNNKALFPTIADRIPLSWRKLIDEIDQLKEQATNNTIISVTSLFEIVKDKCNFPTEDTLRQGLSFIHKMGLVLYYHEAKSLGDVVFLRPQWVANVLKTIIRHDLEKLRDIKLDSTFYVSGSVQFAQDIDDLRLAGRLYHQDLL